MSDPVQLFRIVRASGGGRRGGARALTPFVGREEELGLLQRRWECALAGEGQLALIVGEPGLGKSRLIEEFHARLGETPHTWVEWSASQLLQNTPLHPIAEWGRQRFGADAPAEQRLADLEGTLRLIGLDPAEYAPLLGPLVDIPLPPDRAMAIAPEEMRRRQMAALVAWVLAATRQQPVALAFEDLHWADPTSLDLLRALAERGEQAPLFIIATARPEFRLPWGMRSHHSVISLAPLDRAQVAQMVGEISSRHALSEGGGRGGERAHRRRAAVRRGGDPPAPRARRSGRLAGDPADASAVARRAARPARRSARSRADRRGAGARFLLCAAARRRRPCSREAAAATRPRLQSALDRLVDADLCSSRALAPQATYRFKHALIQDAAYESLLKSRRQALHRRAAEACATPSAPSPRAIAHHFTEAGLDDLAIEWWGKAGDQALRRSAFQEAIAHLGKAIAMADKAAGAVPRRAECGGLFEPAAEVANRLRSSDDVVQRLRRRGGQGRVRPHRRIHRASRKRGRTFVVYQAQCLRSIYRGELGQARETAEAFLREAEARGRAGEKSSARCMLGLISLHQGDPKAARSLLQRALADYVHERDGEMEFVFGRNTEVNRASFLSLTEWHLGEVERARQLIDQAIRDAQELDQAGPLANALHFKTHLESRRDDAAATREAADALLEIAGGHGIKSHNLPAPNSRELGAWSLGRPGGRRE